MWLNLDLDLGYCWIRIPSGYRPRFFMTEFKKSYNWNIFSVLHIRNVYSGSWILILSVPDLGFQIQKQKRGMKKIFVVIPFFVATKSRRRKKFGQFTKNHRTFYPKFSWSYSKYGFGIQDSGSEIRDPEKNLFRIRIIFWIKNIHKCLLNPFQRTSMIFKQEIS